MTTPIRNILDINAQPPYGVGLQELNRLFRDLSALYERLTKEDREAFLEKDFLSLFSAHVSTQADIKTLEEKRLAMIHPGRNVDDLVRIQFGIERIASHLLSIANSLNARLSESLIKRLSNYEGGSESKFNEIIKWAYITPVWKTQKETDSDTKGERMGNNTTANPETPPATKKTLKVAALQPYTPKPVGRTAGLFAETIANTYKDKAEIIQEHTGTALASMTDPKAVIALLVVYFRNGILKQCPTYWQMLRLLGIEAENNTDKEKLCPFGMHQQYDKQRKIFFDENDSYLSLNETDREQDNKISSFIQDATTIHIELLAKLIQEPTEQARQGA